MYSASLKVVSGAACRRSRLLVYSFGLRIAMVGSIHVLPRRRKWRQVKIAVMAIETIMFDLGKVLIDFSLEPALAAMRGRCSKPGADFDRIFHDSRLAFLYESGEITTAEFYERLREAGGLEMDFADFHRAWCGMFNPNPLVSETLLQTLRRKYPLILISNTNEAHVEYLAGRYPLLDYFEHKVFSFEVRLMKPDRRIFEHAIHLSGKSPGQLFFVDDREENVKAARDLGIHAHQFTCEDILVRVLSGLDVEVGDFVRR
jgi:glucose-1-phosphatase